MMNSKSLKVLRKLATALFVLILFAAFASAGIRGPGEYSGVVIFDHWDTCYLYDGVYLMYISEQVKERVRKYEGQMIRIDAKKVYQPMNPGDGLIKEFKLLEVFKTSNASQFSGLTLTITPKLAFTLSPTFMLEVKNAGTRKLIIPKWEMAPTLFGERIKVNSFSPSDGKSDACITRWSFPFANGEARSFGYTTKTEDGQTLSINKSYALTIDDGHVPWDCLTLYPGQSARFSASFLLSPGTYDFLFGYAPGDGKISNLVSFAVGRYGIPTIISDRRIGKTAKI